MGLRRKKFVWQSTFFIFVLLVLTNHAFGFNMQDAGISQRAQDYIIDMQYSDDATSHAAFQNCLRDIIRTKHVPDEAEVITREDQLGNIRPGGIYVIRGNLTFTDVFNVPSDVTIYVDGSIFRHGTFTGPNGVHPTENGTDAIFMVDGKKDINLIGVNNAKLSGNWTTGDSKEPGTTAVYINKSSNVTVEGFDIGYVWEGLVARGGNDHINFLNNYVHDTRKRAIWIITSEFCEIVHNFVDNAGVDGVDFDAYAYDNIAFENVVVGAGRWLGFVEEGAKRNTFARNVGIMAYFDNPNTGYQMGWVDNGSTQGIVDRGGLTEDNYFIANISIRPGQFTTSGSGQYVAHINAGKGWSYFWGNTFLGSGKYTAPHATGDKYWYRAEWLDTVPSEGQQQLDDMDARYNPTMDTIPMPPTDLSAD